MRLLVFAALVATASQIQAFSLPPGVDMREIKYLMSIVDPPTCGCVLPTACEVHIPNAHFVGLRCNGQQVRFCCRRKKNPNAKTNFQLTPELVEKTRRLAAPKVKESLEELLDVQGRNVIIKPAAAALPATTSTTTAAPETTSDPAERECACVESSECRTDKVDFSFGKSCGFGFVRCCDDGIIREPSEDVSGKDNAVVEEITTVLKPDDQTEGRNASDHPSTRVQLADHFVPKKEEKNTTKETSTDVVTKLLEEEETVQEEKVEVVRPPPKERVTVVTPGPEIKVVASQSRDSTGRRNAPRGPPLSRREEEETYRSYMKFVEYHNELFRRQQARRRWEQQQQEGGLFSGVFRSISDMFG